MKFLLWKDNKSGSKSGAVPNPLIKTGKRCKSESVFCTYCTQVEGLNGQLPNLDLVNMVNKLTLREGLHPMFKARPLCDPVKMSCPWVRVNLALYVVPVAFRGNFHSCWWKITFHEDLAAQVVFLLIWWYSGLTIFFSSVSDLYLNHSSYNKAGALLTHTEVMSQGSI